MIRITGGKNRSRLLLTPEGTQTKPTMDKVRQGVFSALSSDKLGNVLDLFAGSGSYGFEALSRGADSVTFVDKNRNATKCIKENAKNLKEDNVAVIEQDVISCLDNSFDNKFDVIFIDPPYKDDVYEIVVNKILNNDLLSSSGIIVLESENELNIPESSFQKIKFYKYGLAKIYILRK